MNRLSALLIVAAIVALMVAAVTYPAQAQQQQQSSGSSPAAENVPEVNYHLTVMMPQYRFLDSSGYGGRVGEYDSLQQSLGGDLSLHFVDIPRHMSIRTTANFLSRDDYDMKSSLTFGKWFDLGISNRSFVRHLDDNSFFAAAVISPDIIRTDSIPPDSLLGIRRTTTVRVCPWWTGAPIAITQFMEATYLPQPAEASSSTSSTRRKDWFG